MTKFVIRRLDCLGLRLDLFFLQSSIGSQVSIRNYACGTQNSDGSVNGNGKFKSRGNEGENNMGFLAWTGFVGDVGEGSLC